MLHLKIPLYHLELLILATFEKYMRKCKPAFFISVNIHSEIGTTSLNHEQIMYIGDQILKKLGNDYQILYNCQRFAELFTFALTGKDISWPSNESGCLIAVILSLENGETLQLTPSIDIKYARQLYKNADLERREILEFIGLKEPADFGYWCTII